MTESIIQEGLLLVIDGADKGGKKTQSDLLVAFFRNQGFDAEYISYPNYGSPGAAMVEAYLRGDFGDPFSIDPYIALGFYAHDRKCHKPVVDQLIASGKILVCDRYVPSNEAHQAARLKNDIERRLLIRYIDWLEHQHLRLRRAHATMYLRTDATIRSKRVVQDGADDAYETHEQYQREVGLVFDQLAKDQNYITIECGSLSKEEIHAMIISELRSRQIIPS